LKNIKAKKHYSHHTTILVTLILSRNQLRLTYTKGSVEPVSHCVCQSMYSGLLDQSVKVLKHYLRLLTKSLLVILLLAKYYLDICILTKCLSPKFLLAKIPAGCISVNQLSIDQIICQPKCTSFNCFSPKCQLAKCCSAKWLSTKMSRAH
jgi:hypothetical protein